MEHDEHEMLVEYSEMTAFNFDSKEYADIKQDYLNCQEKANNIEGFFRSLINRFICKTV